MNNYNEENYKIEGRNPVMEALKADRSIDKLYIQTGELKGSVGKIISLAKSKKIVITRVEKQKLDAMSETKSHQGVIAVASAGEYYSIDDILKYAEQKGEKPFVIICDEINDPHNLGSIIRTANAAGAHGVVIPKRNSVGLTATVAKTSAGAVEFTKVARVSNLARTIDELKEKNIWITAADMDGDKTIYTHDFSGGVAMVIGSEGFGISRLVKEKCDLIVKIPMLGEITSLNASVAGALMIYEVVRSRLK